MDFSESYIRMCNKAVEIQDNAVKPYGDPDQGEYFYCLSCKNRLQEDDGQHGNYYFCICDGRSIWLPRQDQLQEMVLVDSLPIFGVKKGKEDALLGIMRKNTLDKFKVWLDAVVKVDHSFCHKHNSMEQFWFLFVMSQKYSKQWNGNNWVKV